jgi:bifunctional DNA-binding transcriptional regulator/antitoxin component of YhaV-PrlF toxin-antitoxin module
VVDIDDRGRMTIPKEMGLRGGRAAIIPAGSFLVIVPIIGEPYQVARDWLDTERDAKELKELGERKAAEDAVKRAKRRKQL